MLPYPLPYSPTLYDDDDDDDDARLYFTPQTIQPAFALHNPNPCTLFSNLPMHPSFIILQYICI